MKPIRRKEEESVEGKPAKPIKGQQGVGRSFGHAYRGLVLAVRTQRNMRFHVVSSAVVLVASLLAGVSAPELAVLILVISAVLVTEMLNTALEFTVDLVTREYHPLAKLAKDVSAGAVLVTSVAAVAVGGLILGDDLGPLFLGALEHARLLPGQVTLVVLVFASVAVLLGKALAPRSYSFAPSGHAAVAFAAWVAASFVAADGGAARFAGPVSLITLLLALLVCQSRVEGGLRTPYEVAAGAALGALLALAVFQLL